MQVHCLDELPGLPEALLSPTGYRAQRRGEACVVGAELDRSNAQQAC